MPSDGCTGFWFAEWIFPTITHCCVEHDLGGSDGLLLDCLSANLPWWAYVVASFCVATMVLLRPIYHLIKKQ